MVQYVKARLYNKTNGAFKANGIIVKRKMSAIDGVAAFYFVSKEALDGSTRNNGRELALDELRVVAENGGIYSVQVMTGSDIDSFETMLIGEGLRPQSVFSNYRVILGDDVFTADAQTTVRFDSLFNVEVHDEPAAGGVLIKDAYTQSCMYSGFYTYHHHSSRNVFNRPIQNNLPYRIGIELELYARTPEAYNKIITAHTNWFQCESDSSLGQHLYPIEMKTIPLRPADATSTDFWAQPMAKLAQLAVSKGFSSTGLHVHISKEILGSTEHERETNLNKLIWFYTYFVEDDQAAHEKNVVICGRERGYGAIDGGAKTELGDFAKLMGLTEVAKHDAAYTKMMLGIKEKCRDQRGDINIKHWNDYGTIEFRKGKGIISKTRVAAICTWWEQMCLYCKETHQRDLNFNDFFQRVMRFPAVAHFFQQDEEC